MERTAVVSVLVQNLNENAATRGFVAEWDPNTGKVSAADYADVGPIGVFSIFVERAPNQYVIVFTDLNDDQQYQAGIEPAWIHCDSSGSPIPIEFDDSKNTISFQATLSRSIEIPPALIQGIRDFKGDRTAEEAATGWRVPIEIGVVADLDSEKFSPENGDNGLWEPASFAMNSGFGLYFLEEYDPKRTPVIFVYGATGSPQNWRFFFDSLDRSKYQAWFYFYPTGRRLDQMGYALNRCIELLRERYRFSKAHLIAHSMGGLVARSALLHHLDSDDDSIVSFVSLSTPWGGLKSVNAGIKLAPSVVPSWYDMSPDSPFLQNLFAQSLSPRIDHLLIYTTKASASFVLPRENDGTVSVASETLPAAVNDADATLAIEEDHVSILRSKEAFQAMEAYLNRNH